MASTSHRRVLVTGASGNLGRKLVEALVACPWCEAVVAVDREFPVGLLSAGKRTVAVAADLTAPTQALREAIASVDAIVHLAAQNPYPEASWEDADGFFRHDAQRRRNSRLKSAEPRRTKRLVFASSNHVMGGYKDERPVACTRHAHDHDAAASWHAGHDRRGIRGAPCLCGRKADGRTALRRQGFHNGPHDGLAPNRLVPAGQQPPEHDLVLRHPAGLSVTPTPHATSPGSGACGCRTATSAMP